MTGSHPDLISIVVPVYNRADIVERTLASIQAQTHRPLRVILVDNASTDSTYDVLKAWSEGVAGDIDVTLLECPTPGVTAARNMGLGHVSTPWVMFFDSDDTMSPDHIESVIEAIEADPAAEMLGWDVRLKFLDGTEAVKPFRTCDLLFHNIFDGTFATQRYACRTDMVRAVGAWAEDVKVWNDIELATRLLTAYPDARVKKIPGIHVDVYQSAVSITGMTMHERGKEREHSIKRMYSTLIDKPQRFYPLLKGAILAGVYAQEGHHDDAKRLISELTGLAISSKERILLRAAYKYTSLRGRGIAKILRPLIG